MKLARRLMYLGYYFRHMNWPTLRRFMRHTKPRAGIGGMRGRCSLS